MISDLNLAFDLFGDVAVSERGKKGEHEIWSVIRLVEHEKTADISLTITYAPDDGCRISMSAHHIENDETKRAFHAVLDGDLSWKNIAQLRHFLELLAKFEGYEGE